jgi:hypothetical protein
MAHGNRKGHFVRRPLKNRLKASYTQIREQENEAPKRHFLSDMRTHKRHQNSTLPLFLA